MSAGDSYSLGCMTHSSPSNAPSISDAADNSCNINPMSFLNIMTSCDENVAWNSSLAVDGRMMSNETRCNVAASVGREYQQLYQDSSALTCTSAMQQSSIFAELPADLLCIDASSVTDRTDVSLPTLTVRDQQSDSNSLDSLTFDDYSCSSYMGAMFDTGYHSPLHSTHSVINVAATSSLMSTPATAVADNDALDIDDSDITHAAADWSELSALMSETN